MAGATNDLGERVAIVTGGSGGIGQAVCRRLIESGARVVCQYHRGESQVAALQEQLGTDAARLRPLQADLSQSRSIEPLVERVLAEEGRIDALVHGAAATDDTLLLRVDPDRLRRQLALNLEAGILLSRAVLPAMLKRRRGRIVMISSVVAALGNPGQTVYATAKAGLEGFVRSLAREVGRKGITVNCVAPGLIDTNMSGAMPAELRARALENIALGRPGTAPEVAAAIAFLCSDDAAYITGTVLQVNGGMYM
ncbi:MAG: SDR family oxidoreductase [Deltaproteobacteria bacterium]|nr:MAG: SDR family oxidoreductase [Deltaproteobacteria bacterium]